MEREDERAADRSDAAEGADALLRALGALPRSALSAELDAEVRERARAVFSGRSRASAGDRVRRAAVSVALAGAAASYLVWAATFASALYH